MRGRALPGVLAALAVATVAPTASAEPRSTGTAHALSGVGTGASAALFLSAFLVSSDEGEVNMPLLYAGLGTGLVTPSLGQFYAGEYLTLGMAIRAGAGALATFAVLQYSQNVRCPTLEFDDSCTNLRSEAYALLGIAAIALVGGAAYDIKELRGSVERYNRRHGYTLAPMLIPSGPPGAHGAHGATGAGLGLLVSGTW